MTLLLTRQFVGGKWRYVAATSPGGINSQTGAVYTLALGDALGIVSMENADPNTIYIPLNADVAFPVGMESLTTIRQGDEGTTTVEGLPGVTVNGRDDALSLAGRYAYASLIQVATDTWELTGDTA